MTLKTYSTLSIKHIAVRGVSSPHKLHLDCFLPVPSVAELGLSVLQEMLPGPGRAALAAEQQAQLGRRESAQAPRREDAGEAAPERRDLTADAFTHDPARARFCVRACVVRADLGNNKQLYSEYRSSPCARLQCQIASITLHCPCTILLHSNTNEMNTKNIHIIILTNLNVLSTIAERLHSNGRISVWRNVRHCQWQLFEAGALDAQCRDQCIAFY